MGVTIRSFILATLLTVVALCVYRISVILTPPVADDTLDRYPTFVSDGFYGENYTEDGRLTAVLNASHVEFFEKTGLITMVDPQGIWHDYSDSDDSTPQSWQLNARRGTYVIDRYATLDGNIVLTPLFEDPFVSRVTTTHLEYDLLAGEIFSESPVTIEGNNFINQGTGFNANLKTGVVTLKGEPHARYLPDTH